MSSVRFFPEINEALKKIKDLLRAIEKYKEREESENKSENEYQKISEVLWCKRFSPESSVDTRLDLLSDVSNQETKIGLFSSQIMAEKNTAVINIYSKSLHNILQLLKEDIELYKSFAKPGETENKICKDLEELVDKIDKDLGVGEDEDKTTTNKM